MSLRLKAAFFIGFITILSSIAFYGIFRGIILKSFSELETRSAEKDMNRCISAFEQEVEHLDRFVVDWSTWDDSYRFTQLRDPRYIRSNLVWSTFQDQHINLIHIYDAGGKLLWGKTFDLASGRELQLDLSSELKPEVFSRLIGQTGADRSIKGIIQTRYGKMIIASNPILPSEGNAPSHGAMIMGRFFDKKMLTALSQQVEVNLKAWPAQGGYLPEAEHNLLNFTGKGHPVKLVEISPSELHAYSVIRDIGNDPAILLEASLQRYIMEKGRRAYTFGLFFIIGVGAVILISVSGMLGFMVLKPITKLKDAILSIREVTKDVPGLITKRKDEIGTLTREFSFMLQRLSRSEEHYRYLSENARDVIWVVDLDLKYLYISPSVMHLRGYTPEEAMKLRIDQVLTPGSYQKIMEVLSEKDFLDAGKENIRPDWSKTMELELVRKDGTTVWTEAMANPIFDEKGMVKSIMGITRDITERKRIEEEKKKIEFNLLQTQKMEALGRLAGGIAHDLNNILYPVIINTEMLLEEIPPETRQFAILQEILLAACRQKNLVNQILSFSRGSEQCLTPMRITPIIQEALNFLRYSLPSSIEIHQNLEVPSDVIIGDQTQIHQIIMNLCRNAADAIGSQPGIIEVNLSSISIGTQQGHLGMKPGQYLRLSVKDTGCGMSPDIKERIFEPFFSTKEKGKGTGMGLPVVHGILKSHNGSISVESEPGKGSLFTVYIPTSEEQIMSENQDHPEILNGKEKILLIDDEPTILSSMERVLHHSGYHVVASSDSLEAVNLFSSNPSAFDLVVTDLTMPRMTGVELADKIRKIRADIPIILCTGYSEIIDELELEKIGIRQLLLKPSSTQDLKTVVRRALEKSNQC